ncbi:MAG: manganese transporter, partial [Alphaproteobacteria bacterium HGW-Alphaproteobacteria-8]
MRLTRRRFTVSAMASAALAAGGARAQQSPQQSPLIVVATTGMVADAARAVGGDDVAVTALMGPGVDPHSWRQTRTDVAAMARADLVLRHGLYLEAQLEDFFVTLARRTPVVAVAESLARDRLRAHDSYENRFDPHVWMVPELWLDVVGAVRDALSAARPSRAEAFSVNYAGYSAEIAALGRYARDRLATVPPRNRVLVTAHDAFGYFGAAYGFQVEGIQGISTEAEAGLQRIEALVALLVERGVGAVFVESSVSARNLRALIEGAAARGHAVTIGAELFSDAMGAEGSYEGTYLGMIDHNVTAITRALGGAAPERGMRGLLGA